MSQDRYVFVVEWYDTSAALVRQYNFTYYTKSQSIEMFDIKNHRIFLKKTQFPSIQPKDLFIGATLTVYSRQLKVVDYADQFTKLQFQKQKGKTLLLIKPDGYLNIGKIINRIQQEGFTIGNVKMAKMTQQQGEKLFADNRGKPHFNALVEQICSDLIVGIQLISDDCINRAKTMVGPLDFKTAQTQSPDSMIATYGKSSIQNAVYTSQSSNVAVKDLQFFFSAKSALKCPAYFTSCSCLVIKPHIMTDGYCGQIIDIILNAGFEISAMQMFWLDRPSADQFLEVYKTILPQYNQLVEQLTNGPCLALEVRQNNAVSALREVCGPHDPQVAKSMRPKSIRSIFGKDKQKNAVHCTDLMEDAIIQVEYFFNILQK